VSDEVGDVTVLVNNAGVVTGKTFYELPDKMVELTFNVNTVAHLWVCLFIICLFSILVVIKTIIGE